MKNANYRWANEAARRAEVINARTERENRAAENAVSVILDIDMSGFITAMRNLTDAVAGRTPHGTRYYSTRDGRIHRRLGHAPLLHMGRKPRR